MKKVLCLYAHPNARASRANRRAVEALAALGATVHPLYDRYPEFFVDVAAEQRLLRDHDLIIFQHPIYWYSMPPLLKLWLDQVLEFNFAYGPGGNALHGKDFLLSITAGGSAGNYTPEGDHRHHLAAFLPPYRQTAHLCGLRWHAPEVLHDASDLADEALRAHAARLAARVSDIAGGEE